MNAKILVAATISAMTLIIIGAAMLWGTGWALIVAGGLALTGSALIYDPEYKGRERK